MQVNPWNIIQLLRNEISDLRFQVKILKDKVTAFESGEKYIQMKRRIQEITRYYEKANKQLKVELAKAHQETVEVREKWDLTCEDILRETEIALEKMRQEVEKAQEKQLEAERKRDAALDRAKEKNAEMYAAKAALEEEIEKNKALTAKIHKDYTNSSKPSSADPNHKTIHNSREKSGKKPGGQPEHKHHPRKRQEPTKVVEIPAPEEYTDNPNFKPTGKIIWKQVVGITVTLNVTEYRTPEFRNQTTGQRVHAAFPHGLKDEVTYDGTVKAFAFLLNNQCDASIDKTSTFIHEITGGKLNLANGTICNLAKEFSQKTRVERDEIFLQLFSSPVMHADFTFGRANGKQIAVMICVTPDGKVLYQAREKKGREGVVGSPLEHYEGTVVSDHEKALAEKGSRHQECLSHIKRYTQSAAENEPDRKWPPLMLDWIKDSIHFWNLRDADEPVEESRVNELISQMHSILEMAKEEYLDTPPSSYFTDGFNTYKRMHEEEAEYILFLVDPSVPPTNNIAERSGRKFKRKSHQVISFRSFQGAEYYCDALSVLESLRSAGLNLFEEVSKRFE